MDKAKTYDPPRRAQWSRSLLKSGFSLLELLAVMAIMAMLATLAVSSYFAAVKGMAARSAKRHFEDALISARQRACIDGVRVSLMAFNEIGGFDSEGNVDENQLIACYVICKEIGRISYIQNDYLFDEFSDLEKLFGVKSTSSDDATSVSSSYQGGFRLYNLSQGAWTLVEPQVTLQKMGTGKGELLYSKNYGTQSDEQTHQFQGYAFKKQSGTYAKSSGAKNWAVGDIYGIEVAPIQNLPKGFKFQQLSDDTKDVQCVTFEPDGSLRGGSANFTIKGSNASANQQFQFTINSDGKISY